MLEVERFGHSIRILNFAGERFCDSGQQCAERGSIIIVSDCLYSATEHSLTNHQISKQLKTLPLLRGLSRDKYRTILQRSLPVLIRSTILLILSIRPSAILEMGYEATAPEGAIVGIDCIRCRFADATKVADVGVVFEEGGYVLSGLGLNVSLLYATYIFIMPTSIGRMTNGFRKWVAIMARCSQYQPCLLVVCRRWPV